MRFLNRLTLRARIFLSMLVLLVLSFLFTGAFSIYHFWEESQNYHENRLERKAATIIEAINYHLSTYDMVSPSNLDTIISPKINEWADINNLDIVFYNMEGKLVLTSNAEVLKHKDIPERLNPAFVLNIINKGGVITKSREDEKTILLAYKFIRDSYDQPLAIVSMPYFQSEDIPKQDIEFLEYLITINVILFLLAVVIAIFLSNYITQSLTTIGDKLQHTQINKNVPLIWKSNDEIGRLVDAYNRMLNELEENALKLAKSERESAWKEMAKQVAHEIKNPLTPMRLLVQQLEFSLKTDDKAQLQEFTKAMIEQIDTLVNIADAFSRFANMPTVKKEVFNVVDLIEHATAIFSNLEITAHLPEQPVNVLADREQLLRVFNNLIKNAWQAVPEDKTPVIEINIAVKTKTVLISFKDNGTGIEESKKDRIFEPSFTTKTHGMGLGLAMAKSIIENLNGDIWFENGKEQGAVFFIEVPRPKE